MPILTTPKYAGSLTNLMPAPKVDATVPTFTNYNLDNPMSYLGFNPTLDRDKLSKGVSNIKDEKNRKLAYMLYALGGALRGDRDFVQNTLALQQMEEGKKKQEAQKEAFSEFLEKYEGTIDPRITDFAKVLGPEKGSQIVMSEFADPEGTARQREYSQLQSILEDPNKTPEEKDLAKKFFAGISTGKSKEETIRQLVASLAKTINPMTSQLYTPKEIQEQINEIGPLLDYEESPSQATSGSFKYDKYTITPED